MKPDGNNSRFKASINSFGNLWWEFKPCSQHINFLDLDITITTNRIKTKVYKKPNNSHQYLPSQSSHPPSVTIGMIIGMVKCTFQLSTEESNALHTMKMLYFHLLERGYQLTKLLPIFNKALQMQHDTDNNNKKPLNMTTTFSCIWNATPLTWNQKKFNNHSENTFSNQRINHISHHWKTSTEHNTKSQN